MKAYIPIILSAFYCAGSASGVISLTSDAPAGEDFDGLPLTSQAGLFAGTGEVVPLAGTTFDGAKIGGNTTAMALNASTGTNTAGAIYSFGATGETDRALGSVASGTQIGGFGVRIENNTGSPVSALFLQLTQENWRSSTGEQNVTPASWAMASADAGITDANYLTSSSGAFVTLVPLNLEGPAPEADNGELDGNLPANQIVRSTTLTFTTPLAVGDSIYLRWLDSDNTGSDAGLAIDNFSATVVPEPACVVLLAAGMMMVFRRQRT